MKIKERGYNRNMTILDVKNLGIGFQTENGFRQALWDVSLSLKKGSTLALVGESGCGKSITAMSILQLLPKTARITSGEIIYGKENIITKNTTDMQKIRGKKIALIPQDPMTSLNPLYTVGDQLLEVIKIHQGLTGNEATKKAIESLEEVQIPSAKERMKAYPHELSGGMKQRAIIAMALACNAEILIADEPTTALDVTIQSQIMDLIREIKASRDTAVLLITHDLALVKENAEDIVVMYAGRIVEQAPANELFTNSKHPYTTALLNSIPTNRGRTLDTIQGQPPTINQEITGCRFHPRCKKCFDVCINNLPELKQSENNHYCACHLY